MARPPSHEERKVFSMKQLGNLAIACAKRPDIVMTTQDGMVFVRSRVTGKSMSAPWDNDKKIERLVHELNFGAFAGKRSA